MQAHSYEKRVQVIKRWQSGEKMSQLSRSLKIDYETLRQWVKRYKEDGLSGLKTRYGNCGRRPKTEEQIRQKALAYKRTHTQWGAGFIRIQLQRAYPESYIPGVRQLQRWFARAQLNKSQTHLAKYPLDWANRPLARVQVDANERLQTKDGQACCYLTYTDEYSGSALEAFVFPLCSH